MAAEFTVHILSAEQAFYEGPATSLILPGCDGQFGVMAHRSDLVASIVPGMLTCRTPEGDLTAVVGEGLVRVEDNDVLVLVNDITRPEDIDEKREQREAARAREAMLQKQSHQEYLQAQATLARAMSRIQAAKGRQ